jgi:hypothetical protein
VSEQLLYLVEVELCVFEVLVVHAHIRAVDDGVKRPMLLRPGDETVGSGISGSDSCIQATKHGATCPSKSWARSRARESAAMALASSSRSASVRSI